MKNHKSDFQMRTGFFMDAFQSNRTSPARHTTFSINPDKRFFFSSFQRWYHKKFAEQKDCLTSIPPCYASFPSIILYQLRWNSNWANLSRVLSFMIQNKILLDTGWLLVSHWLEHDDKKYSNTKPGFRIHSKRQKHPVYYSGSEGRKHRVRIVCGAFFVVFYIYLVRTPPCINFALPLCSSF